MEDSEHAAAPLRYSGKLSVKNSVAAKIPAFANGGEEGGEVTVFLGVGSPSAISNLTLRFCASAVRGQEAGDVLENQPTGPQLASNAKGDEGQVAASPIHSDPLPGDREVLAGASENKDIWPPDPEGSLDEVFGIHVSQVDRARVVVREHRGREILDLGAEKPVPMRNRAFRCADTAEEGRPPEPGSLGKVRGRTLPRPRRSATGTFPAGGGWGSRGPPRGRAGALPAHRGSQRTRSPRKSFISAWWFSYQNRPNSS